MLPFYGYARQDKKHRGREPISARLMADLFKTAGANRLMAVDLHTAQIQGFFDGPVDHLMALPILADYVAREVRPPRSSPWSRPTPAGSRSPSSGRSGSAARRWPSSTRRRDINRPNEIVANRVVGEVKGRVCVLVDDMIDTGGTITKAADALMADGAPGVVIAATHAILSGPAVDRLKACSGRGGHRHQHAADRPTTGASTSSPCSRSRPLISRAIQEVFEDGSVTSLFDGHA